jgi:hypothetical protein
MSLSRIERGAGVGPVRVGHVALRRVALAAVPAGPARDGAVDQDAVAGAEPAHRVADLLDDADGLVAEDRACLHRRHRAAHEVEVGAADRAAGDADDGVVRVLDGRLLDLVETDVPDAVPDDCLHVCLLDRFGCARGDPLGTACTVGRAVPRDPPSRLRVRGTAAGRPEETPRRPRPEEVEGVVSLRRERLEPVTRAEEARVSSPRSAPPWPWRGPRDDAAARPRLPRGRAPRRAARPRAGAAGRGRRR